MLCQRKATSAEYKAGLNFVVKRGWLVLHERGNFTHYAATRDRAKKAQAHRCQRNVFADEASRIIAKQRKTLVAVAARARYFRARQIQLWTSGNLYLVAKTTS
jgi:hypothetical protein